MARYRKYQNKNRMSSGYGKFYLKPIVEGRMTTQEIAEIVQSNASVKLSDVLAVQAETKDVITNYLGLGYQVKLDGIGTFQVRVRSKGALTPEDCTPASCIKSVGVLYRPDVKRESDVYSKPLLRKLRWKEQADYTSPKTEHEEDGD